MFLHGPWSTSIEGTSADPPVQGSAFLKEDVLSGMEDPCKE